MHIIVGQSASSTLKIFYVAFFFQISFCRGDKFADYEGIFQHHFCIREHTHLTSSLNWVGLKNAQNLQMFIQYINSRLLWNYVDVVREYIQYPLS